MPYCSECGTENKRGVKFCLECGVRIAPATSQPKEKPSPQNKVKLIPEWFLHKNERIIHKFDLKVPLYLTNDRIVLTKSSFGKMGFQDISLKHLTSIKAKKRTSWRVIFGGVGLLVVASIFGSAGASTLGFNQSLFFGISAPFIAVGILLVIVGFLRRPKEVIFVSDSGDTIKVRVKNEEQIEETIKTVREYE